MGWHYLIEIRHSSEALTTVRWCVRNRRRDSGFKKLDLLFPLQFARVLYDERLLFQREAVSKFDRDVKSILAVTTKLRVQKSAWLCSNVHGSAWPRSNVHVRATCLAVLLPWQKFYSEWHGLIPVPVIPQGRMMLVAMLYILDSSLQEWIIAIRSGH